MIANEFKQDLILVSIVTYIIMHILVTSYSDYNPSSSYVPISLILPPRSIAPPNSNYTTSVRVINVSCHMTITVPLTLTHDFSLPESVLPKDFEKVNKKQACKTTEELERRLNHIFLNDVITVESFYIDTIPRTCSSGSNETRESNGWWTFFSISTEGITKKTS